MILKNITGIVLAGGKSSRMGCNKALMEFKGKPLIQHAVDILRQVCDHVIISANTDDYQFTGCETWPDEFPFQAPMIGIYSCLKRSGHRWNIVLSCDMPLVKPHLFETLLSNHKQADVVLPIHDAGCIEPLCGLYNRQIITGLEEHIRNQDYGLQHFIKTTRLKLVDTDTVNDFQKSNMFVNVNTAEDFDLLS
jgi:molybdopterin-guanine dinucleotide biosynthesis protein A